MTKIIGSGLNLTALPNCDFTAMDAMLARYVEIGCTHVEVSARRVDLILGGRIVEVRAEAAAAILDKHEIGGVLHADHALNFMDLPNIEMHRAVLTASIDLAKRMELKSIVVHSGHVPSDVWLSSSKDLLAQEREELARMGDLAAKAGVRLAVENLIADPWGKHAVYGADPRALAQQLRAIDHPAIGGCLDFGHAYLSASTKEFDFLDAITDFSDQVWHLHLHDNCGIPNTGRIGDAGGQVSMGIGDLHAPMGWGTISWEHVLPAMQFREGTFAMIELNGRYRGVEDYVAATARAFGDYWNGSKPLQDVLPG